jgi:hypothetical protein
MSRDKVEVSHQLELKSLILKYFTLEFNICAAAARLND